MRIGSFRSILVVATLLAGGPIAQGQQPKNVPRIGYLSADDAASESSRAEPIRLALRDRGYIEGQNIATEYRYAEGKRDRLPELAAELVRLKVDIIIAAGGDALIRPAMNATKTIPIVMVGPGLDPVKAGLIESLARPGGNVTGLTNLSSELAGKRLELFLATAILISAPTAQAQQSDKIFRIGFLDSSTASGSKVRVDAFRQELSKLGWIEGKNIAIEYRFGEGQPERQRELAGELVRLKVDLIVTSGGTMPSVAKRATTTIPIVMTIAADPVGQGLVASLARPGGNITGNSSLADELTTKRLEILKDAIPRLSRVGLLRSSRDSILLNPQTKLLRPSAQALKLHLEDITTPPNAKGLESAFQTAKQKHVGAILLQSSRNLFTERKRIVELAVKYRLPAIYFQDEFVEAGGLMSYGADFDDLFRKAAHYVDKILKGAKPADLPVQQATKFEFVINLKAAKQIGLTLSPEFLSRANRVIK